MLPAVRASALRTALLATPRRSIHQTSMLSAESVPDAIDDGKSVKGRTGGGDALDSSSNAPPKPKISNLSVPVGDKAADMSEEQKKEVAQHNKEFDEKHDRGNVAADDKVDKKFWTG